jgi:hypothetical protein
MGYFANGTEHEMYVEAYCEKCRNWYMRGLEKGLPVCYNSCPIMDMHFLAATMHRGRALDELLDLFIPREEGKNLECTMFVDY